MDSDTSPSQPSPPASLDAEVAAFLSAPTPRRDIPPKIKSAAYAQVSQTMKLFVAAMFVALGLFMIVLPILPSPVRHDEELSRKHATAQGIVLSAEPVSIQVGARGARHYITVFRFSFAFTPTAAGGAQAPESVHGVCYADTKLWWVTEPVAVEYNPENAAIARIQGARLAEGNAGGAWLGGVVIMSAAGLFFLCAGIWIGRKYFKQRALSRWLLENGAVDEFLVVDMNIDRRMELGSKGGTTYYVFQLKPANRDDDKHSYFSEFTEKSQSDDAEAVLHAKTTTFGIYDPTSTDDKRLVLMVESWFQ